MAAKKKTAVKKSSSKKKTVKKPVAKKKAGRNLQSLLGKTFYFCDPWEWDDDEEPLFDSDGEVLSEISGDWEITSVDDNENGDIWASITVQGRDFQIQLPIDFLPGILFED
jgi:hypothetical protein